MHYEEIGRTSDEPALGKGLRRASLTEIAKYSDGRYCRFSLEFQEFFSHAATPEVEVESTWADRGKSFDPS